MDLFAMFNFFQYADGSYALGYLSTENFYFSSTGASKIEAFQYMQVTKQMDNVLI